LTDDQFYMLAACNAPVGKDCRAPYVRWPKNVAHALGLAVVISGSTHDAGKHARIQAAVAVAIAEINSAGSGVQFRLVPEGQAKMVLHIVTRDEMRAYVKSSSSSSSREDSAAVGYSTIWWNSHNWISNAEIRISDEILDRDIQSVVLEEIFQGLGFLTDIRGKDYAGRSILSETSNATVTIGGQDQMLLFRHYPD